MTGEKFVPCATIDYRAENDRLRKELEYQTERAETLTHTVAALNRDNDILIAQLDIVHLIFGGGNHHA